MAVATQRSAVVLAQKLQSEGITNPAVISAIANTPRHLFVETVLAHKAYENTALPIGHGQTISQPYIVARMTELLLNSGRHQQVLEIGTGSGYQTAVLARLFERVCSVERIKSLQFQAKRRLQQLDLHNVSMKHGDGWQGWPSKGPFDCILVTAAPSAVPQALLQQLSDGGRLVIPVGTDEQVLRVITRDGEQFHEESVEAVRFVPLVPGALA
ncbi:protein-L-isoaspartate(D-aspartate) O-methyltransferase [Alkalimonas collagenimarina]|uniref:Protein-L-isoaspartate O-methyltransferase n=1 Tax=Alkalimonas collagenimarina TaxID=400390 RepID=A0ABT9GWU9_9GAMM|nr:protein-L-isoaspartate(D-aspartate) O-methyltransferase [Alkalimonas collagenimarina]MDP4535498.1 protein-L-isoaspartate(D-aspartate) O-methyltransferase [Alkalimonas collagenimarina]